MTDPASGNSRPRFARADQASDISPAAAERVAAARIAAAKLATARLAASATVSAPVAPTPSVGVPRVGVPGAATTVASTANAEVGEANASVADAQTLDVPVAAKPVASAPLVNAATTHAPNAPAFVAATVSSPAETTTPATHRSHLPTVLCVDDDERLLAGLALRLRRHFEVTTAKSAPEALRQLNLGTPFAAVVSDMRMPNVDGSTFLAAMRRVAPETTRILLTGQLDVNSAISAVNDGEVFRFLTKPIESEDLVAVLNEAVVRHQAVMQQRQETRDVMTLAMDLMTLPLNALAPAAAVHSGRLRALTHEIALLETPKEAWMAELAVVVVQSAMSELAPDVAARWRIREPLTENERLLLTRAINRALAALDRLPSTAPVKDALLSITAPLVPGASWRGATSAPMPVRIVHLVYAFDAMRQRGYSDSDTLQQMQADSYQPDAGLMTALKAATSRLSFVSGGVALEDLQLGQRIMCDVRTGAGVLLLPKNHEVLPATLEMITTLDVDSRRLLAVAVNAPVTAS